MKGDRGGAADHRRIAVDRTGDNRTRRLDRRKFDRRRGQMMQGLADLAAVFVVGDLRRGRMVLDNRHREPARERQVMVMPAEQDRLEQHREEAEPCGHDPRADHVSRQARQKPRNTR